MKTVRLFFGGYGVRRDGNTVGPFTRSDSHDYPFASGRSTFAKNGKYVKDGGPIAFDVVAVFDHFPTNEEVLQVRQDLLNDAHPVRNRFIGCCAVAAPWALVVLVLWLLFGCKQSTEPCPEPPPTECADNPKCAGGLGTGAATLVDTLLLYAHQLDSVTTNLCRLEKSAYVTLYDCPGGSGWIQTERTKADLRALIELERN